MNDIQIWSALKEGQSSALEKIYKEHISYLIQYGCRFSQDEGTVEDCIHDLFVDLWRRRERLGDTSSIRAYLLVSLRRSILKSVQKVQKRFSDKEPEELNFSASLDIEEMMVQAELEAEQAEQLNEALQNLSQRQREVLYLRFYQEMDYEEICEIMGISYQSGRNLLAGALKSLRSLIKIPLFLLFMWF